MNILFLTLDSIEDIDKRHIYTDLIRELASRDINIYVVCSRQRRTNLPTELSHHNNIRLLKVKTGNITKTKSVIEKGFSSIRIEGQYIAAVNKYFNGVKFDMVVYSTPPINYSKIVNYFKKRDLCISYLILKDIFPQNAVDLHYMKKNSLLWRYFRQKEIKLYKNSDVIGCMSPANVEYLRKHNDYLDDKKIEIFPNAIEPIDRIEKRHKDYGILKKYKIPEESTIFLYGGNLGKPQGIDFLLEVANHFSEIEKGHLLIVGSGTEFDKLQTHISYKKPANVSILDEIEKNEYDKLVHSSDVGLIFLDRRFTIPNFPSRLTSYMENSLPVLAATDVNSDIKNVLQQSNSGLWCESGDLASFIDYAQILANNIELREQMGINGRVYLEENYDIGKTIEILIKHLN